MNFVLTLRLVGTPSGLETEWNHLDWLRRYGLPEAGRVPEPGCYNSKNFDVPEDFARLYFGKKVSALVNVHIDLLKPGEIHFDYTGRLCFASGMKDERAMQLCIASLIQNVK